jgi:hypothetical protein
VAGLEIPADWAAPDIEERWLSTPAAAVSIMGMSRKSAKGDQAARMRSAAPAIIRSKSWP